MAYQRNIQFFGCNGAVATELCRTATISYKMMAEYLLSLHEASGWAQAAPCRR
jgi:hypothetical protein